MTPAELTVAVDEQIFGKVTGHAWAYNADDATELCHRLRNAPYFFEFMDFLFLSFGVANAGLVKPGHQIAYLFMTATPQAIAEAALAAVRLHRKLGHP